jgi:anhydro-N-acetylmuramic acid kinase
MRDPYFDRPPPKSLDRNHFSTLAAMLEHLDDADGAATLGAFTVAATGAALRHLPEAPLRWLVSGGGRRNAFLIRHLAEQFAANVEPIDTIGFDGDALEAQCFAYLALRSRRGAPLSFPTTTGVPAPTPGGMFYPAPRSRPAPASRQLRP